MPRLFPSVFFGVIVIFLHKLNNLRFGFAVKRFGNESSPRKILFIVHLQKMVKTKTYVNIALLLHGR